jgi:hypothetical protein
LIVLNCVGIGLGLIDFIDFTGQDTFALSLIERIFLKTLLACLIHHNLTVDIIKPAGSIFELEPILALVTLIQIFRLFHTIDISTFSFTQNKVIFTSNA